MATQPLGGAPSFDDLYRSEFGSIALVAGTTAGDRTTGEDVAQEAFTRAHQRWDDVGSLDRPGAWVRRVAINLALDRRRRIGAEARALLRIGARRQSHSPGLHSPGIDARHGDSEVWAAVDRLPPRQRAVVALHYHDDLSVAEIADVLDCSVSAATSNLHKARTRLATLLGEAR